MITAFSALVSKQIFITVQKSYKGFDSLKTKETIHENKLGRYIFLSEKKENETLVNLLARDIMGRGNSTLLHWRFR